MHLRVHGEDWKNIVFTKRKNQNGAFGTKKPSSSVVDDAVHGISNETMQVLTKRDYRSNWRGTHLTWKNPGRSCDRTQSTWRKDSVCEARKPEVL